MFFRSPLVPHNLFLRSKARCKYVYCMCNPAPSYPAASRPHTAETTTPSKVSNAKQGKVRQDTLVRTILIEECHPRDVSRGVQHLLPQLTAFLKALVSSIRPEDKKQAQRRPQQGVRLLRRENRKTQCDRQRKRVQPMSRSGSRRALIKQARRQRIGIPHSAKLGSTVPIVTHRILSRLI